MMCVKMRGVENVVREWEVYCKGVEMFSVHVRGVDGNSIVQERRNFLSRFPPWYLLETGLRKDTDSGGSVGLTINLYY